MPFSSDMCHRTWSVSLAGIVQLAWSQHDHSIHSQWDADFLCQFHWHLHLPCHHLHQCHLIPSQCLSHILHTVYRIFLCQQHSKMEKSEYRVQHTGSIIKMQIILNLFIHYSEVYSGLLCPLLTILKEFHASGPQTTYIPPFKNIITCP